MAITIRLVGAGRRAIAVMNAKPHRTRDHSYQRPVTPRAITAALGTLPPFGCVVESGSLGRREVCECALT